MPSQMHQPDPGPACPGCAEPLEEGDRFCGACGYDLSTSPAPPGADRPTLAIGTPVAWPAASGVDSSGIPAPAHRPGDLPGLDSRGDRLPVPGQPTTG
ncbi:phosphatase, partial [Streptomyces sp. NPDC055078]